MWIALRTRVRLPSPPAFARSAARAKAVTPETPQARRRTNRRCETTAWQASRYSDPPMFHYVYTLTSEEPRSFARSAARAKAVTPETPQARRRTNRRCETTAWQASRYSDPPMFHYVYTLTSEEPRSFARSAARAKAVTPETPQARRRTQSPLRDYGLASQPI